MNRRGRGSLLGGGVARVFGRRLATPHVVVSVVLLVLLVVFVLIPLISIVIDSFQWQAGDSRLSRDAQPGSFTLFHWERAFRSPLTARTVVSPLLNSIGISLATGVLALILGGGLAWLIVRTDLPFKRFIGVMAMVPYLLPSYALALAWRILLKNERIGGATGVFEYLTGVAPPDWISYGFFPIAIVLSLHYYPFVYLLISNALRSIDTSLEESAEVLGASRRLIFAKITLPIVLPAVLSAFILAFSRVLGNFGTPYFLGSPVRFATLPTMIYSNLQMRFFPAAYILVILLVSISACMIFVNQRMLGVRRSFVTISGKGFRTKPVRLGMLKIPALVAIGCVLLFAAILPFGLFFWQSVMARVGTYSLSNLTSAFWLSPAEMLTEYRPGLLRNSEILGGLWNTIRLGLASALVAAALGTLIGYAVVKGRGTILSKTLEQLAFVPYLIPGVAFGTLYLGMFIGGLGPIPSLYGTFLLLVLTCAFRNLPFAARTGVSTMMQISGEMEEAAQSLGAGWGRRMKSIVFPLTVRGMIAGFTFVFITTVRELSLIVMLVTPQTRTLTTMTMRYEELGLVQFSNAITVVLVATSLSGVWILNRIGGTRFGGGRAGGLG